MVFGVAEINFKDPAVYWKSSTFDDTAYSIDEGGVPDIKRVEGHSPDHEVDKVGERLALWL